MDRDGDGDGTRTFKTNMENGGSRTRARTDTHTCTHVHTFATQSRDPPQEGYFDWPGEILDGLQNTLDAKGESCPEHRGMFYLWPHTVYSIHSVERTPVAMTCSQLMSSPFKAITKAEVLAHQSGGMDISSSRCHVKAIFFIIDAT